MNQTEVDLPSCDEHGTPVSKMPDCPNCGEDELGMIRPGFAICYLCGWKSDEP